MLRFENCPSVSVEHLAVHGGHSNAGNVNGALTFVNCSSVSVQHAVLACRGFGSRSVACLTVRNSVETGAFTSARIFGCDFSVGHLQTGILLINVSRSFVFDNILRAGDRPPDSPVCRSRIPRSIRQKLICNGIFGAVARDTTSDERDRDLQRAHGHFRTDPALTTAESQ